LHGDGRYRDVGVTAESFAKESQAMIAKRRVTQFRQCGFLWKLSIPLISLFVLVGCNQSPTEEIQPGESPMSIKVTSTAFQHGMTIPKQFTGDGADQSPPLRWSEPPPATKSIGLICDDPDAPRGTWVHWVLFNLPTQTRELEEGMPTTATLPSGAKQGKNDFGNIGYGGPAPPKGKAHRYFFKLYALDVAVDLAPGATKAQLEHAMKGHILAEGQLMRTYKR
jgi:Raf kinase inhibitor-like YbhB/YbcL family protein